MSLYTVKQVAAMTGVPAATLRAWERRYAVVEPKRTDAGYRLYDDDDVARLARMARLVEEGSPASLAAREVAATRPGARNGVRAAGPVSAELAGGHAHPDAGPATADVVAAARTLDADLLDALLADAFARASFETVAEQWLMPVLGALGDAWSTGDLDVAGEHFVSAAVLRRLSAWFEAAPVRPGSPVVLVGLPAGSWHQLGSLTFATCLRRQGVDVRYLGPDVPHDSWLHAAATLEPAASVMSIPTDADARTALATAAALAESGPVFVGGRGAATAPDLPAGVTRLEGGLVAGAESVAAAVRA